MRYHANTYFTRSGLPLFVMPVQAQLGDAVHDHDFSEMVVVLAGDGHHDTAGGSYPIAAGDVFVIHPGERHGYGRSSHLRIVNLMFDLDRLALPLHDLAALPAFHALFALEPVLRQRHGCRATLRLSDDDLARVSELLDTMRRELTAARPGYRVVASGLFLQLVGIVCRAYADTGAEAPRALLRLGGVLAAMEADVARQFTLEELARLGGVSVSTLQREFQRLLGHSPVAHLLRLRCRRAAELLRATDLSIKEIAQRVGFCDGNYLARRFRQELAVSPGDYRRQAQRAAG